MTTDLAAKKRQDNRTTESWLLHAEDRLYDYQRKREAILESSASAPEVVTSGWVPSNQTEAKGIRLADLAEQEAWLGFITRFSAGLMLSQPHLHVVLVLRREYRNRRGRSGWVTPCMARFPVELAKLTGQPAVLSYRASRNTFHAYWREIVDLAAREAIREGLL